MWSEVPIKTDWICCYHSGGWEPLSNRQDIKSFLAWKINHNHQIIAREIIEGNNPRAIPRKWLDEYIHLKIIVARIKKTLKEYPDNADWSGAYIKKNWLK